MAYKDNYKIPTSLNKSFLDQDISFTRNGFLRAVPLKVIFFYIGSMMSLFWVLDNFIYCLVDWGDTIFRYILQNKRTKNSESSCVIRIFAKS